MMQASRLGPLSMRSPPAAGTPRRHAHVRSAADGAAPVQLSAPDARLPPLPANHLQGDLHKQVAAFLAEQFGIPTALMEIKSKGK